MQKYFLITTADEKSWPEDPDVPVLFLGEWCRRYSRKDRWSRMNAQVMPYHWDDRLKLYNDYLYLRDLYEQFLAVLGGELNILHGVEHSTRYWRILVGPWLGYFLQILFDRWESIQKALNNYEIESYVRLEFPKGSMIPKNMESFNDLYNSDEWNQFIYSAIIDYNSNIKPGLINQAQFNQNPKALNKNGSRKFKISLTEKIFKVLSHFNRDNDSVFVSTYLPIRLQWRLDLRFGQMPQWRRVKSLSCIQFEELKRTWTVDMKSSSSFEMFAGKILASNIPLVYLEGYQELVNQANDNGWPRSPKLIWTSNAENSNEQFKAYAAEKSEQGSALVMGQHGGHYGMGLWSFTEEHQLAISDCYLSWGWTEKTAPHIRPVGQLKYKKELKVNHANQSGLLLVTCSIPRYSYHMYSIIVSRQWIDYQEDQFSFCKALSPEIRKNLTVRLYGIDYGWDQALRWQDQYPQVELDHGKQRIEHLIRRSRVYVSTYNATTYLESFTMNVPTIIFWDPKHWELRDSALPYFEELKKAGIFHETPESAAKQVNFVWDDVYAWWNSTKVQSARHKFCERYAYLPDNLVKRVTGSLLDVIHSPKRST